MDIDWRNLAAILAFSLGHAALLVACLNRIHAWPLRRVVLHRFCEVCELLVFLLPALFVWFYGLHGPRLLAGGSWHVLPLPVLAYLVVCGVIALAIPAIAALRWTRPLPRIQLSNHTERIDIGKRLGFIPVGRGPFAFLTRLPGNEFLQLEVSDKEYLVPRLPPEWDGLSILHLSDMHFIGTVDRPFFEQVIECARSRPADLVVFTGDLLDRAELIDWLPETLGRLSAPLGCWFVLGNHDWYVGNDEEVRRRFESLGWRGLAGRSELISHRGLPLSLSGSERPWMGRHPDLSQVPADAFRILLSHTPDNIGWAKNHQIDLMLSGHNHGGQIRLPFFGPVHAPSGYGTCYAGGVFHEPPTLLYVTRGISGTQPLRWNCPPELTRLILRSPPLR